MASRRAATAFSALARDGRLRVLEIIHDQAIFTGKCRCIPAAASRPITSSTAQLGVTELTMPALSPTMTAGNIAEWKVAEGQSFSAGDMLADIETDKATMGWESQDEGVLAKILMPAGSKDIDVGTVVALAVDDPSELQMANNYQPGSTATSSPAAPAADTAAPSPPSASASSFPPHQVWTMPALSPTMTQGNIAKWYKTVGDAVNPGDGIVEVETDKATMMWESVEEGFIAKVLAPDGTQDIQVGSPVVVVVEDEDTVSAFEAFTVADAGAQPAAPAAAAPSTPPPASPTPPPPAPAPAKAPPAAKPQSATAGRVAASPYARRLARDAGINLAAVQGTGPGGRVLAEDVENAVASGTGAASSAGDPSAAFTDAEIKQIQRITAKRLLESKTTVPHYYVSTECAMDSLLAFREKLNSAGSSLGFKISVNDFMIKASAAAMKDVPDVNAAWFGDFIRQYHNVDVTVAVQTPAGLMVPVVRDADIKGIHTISEEVKALAKKAKEGKLLPEDYTGGTFAVSNLGMFGVSSFCPIINPPQAAILGCGATVGKVIMGKDGTPKQVQTMIVTISCDHRVIDGAVAATWLQAFKKYVENPEMLLL